MRTLLNFSFRDMVKYVLILGVVGFVCYVLLFVFGGNVDQSVLRAAKSMTPDPVVSRALPAIWGCSEDDLYRFEVYDKDRNHVGYICKGFLTKGATPRY